MVENTSSRPIWLELFAAAAGLLVLVALAIMIVYLLKHTDMVESEWNRAIYLLSGVESIAFAAAGYFFGREVNRKRAENAEHNAKEAEKTAQTESEKAKQAEKEVAKVKDQTQVLAGSIKNRIASHVATGAKSLLTSESSHFQSIADDLEKLIAITAS